MRLVFGGKISEKSPQLLSEYVILFVELILSQSHQAVTNQAEANLINLIRDQHRNINFYQRKN